MSNNNVRKLRPSTSASNLSRKTSSSKSRTFRLQSNFQAKGYASDNNELDDGSVTPKATYLEKEMAYKKLNDELEKRSYEIFQKIEQYSDRSRKTDMSAAGDAPVSEPNNFYEDPITHSAAGDDEPCANANSSQFHSSRSRISETKSYKTITKSSSYESIGSIRSQKPYSTSNSDTKSIDGVDMKARNRLQKATESVVKCLQSKLISHEGRLADLHLQFRQKIQENTMLESKIRVLEDDRERLLKSISNLQSSADKYSKAAELAKNNLSLKNQAFAALKKDIDMLKREQKQKAAIIQNLQTRLNRCTEENERLKNQTRSSQMTMRDKHHEDRAIIDELQQRVCQLEQQKNILNATIGKQTGLIRTLQNQKVQFLSLLNVSKIPVPSFISNNASAPNNSKSCTDNSILIENQDE